MKKQGFTLIELMVVIVIMGILAAVAVPKLFGMIAKSKASEVGPAAGTYVKLQDAYVAEKGTYIGSWKAIGYADPASTVFTYSGFNSGADIALATGKTVAWSAAAKAALNDCQANSVWTLDVSQNGSTGGAAVYTPKLTGGPTGDCAALTPNYCNIGGNKANCAAAGN
ncbi:type IV pilin [Fibrobacter sp. UWB4]|uniref:type IV pilin protein n=1 Tax=Fibrobacter sp. UWB4 TaxID=1964356 RepID=UPI000B5268B0|nr:type II secretion system protein [Fibrobacter sp. UWB4]MBO4827921.1 type II secretion system protein [Fibrobacter sp.]OWV18423.1 type IV pilin [Fibrobacter sp. UWB4]